MSVNDYTHIRSFGNPGKAVRKVQQMERDGWELVSILPFTFVATIGYTIVLRRAPVVTTAPDTSAAERDRAQPNSL